MPNIYQKIHEANLDKELEVILLKLLWFNHSTKVTQPILKFLENYKKINEDYWVQFTESNSFDTALESYYQYSKNKCKATDLLLDDLNMSLNFDELRNDLTEMMRESFTF
ncbi:MAG: hypothetical protein R3327_01395 [Nitrosopumilaceae archaeon]|nr:hypothetical protein [Nitrosopumilaceae archaeon]